MAVSFKCDKCERSFQTATALGAHKRGAHGIAGTSRKNKARRVKTKAVDRRQLKQLVGVSLDDAIAVLYTKIDALREVVTVLEGLRGTNK